MNSSRRKTGTGHERLVRMDVRVILLLILCTAAASYLTSSLLAHAVLTAALVGLAIAFGQARMGLKSLLAHGVVTGWLRINMHFGVIVPPPMALALVYKMIPILAATLLLFAIPSAKLTAGIRQLPIPANVQLMLTVMLRFAPTVASEAADIRDAMRVRGFLGSPAAIFRNPLNTLEYTIVPLVFRELKLADEISAAAVVRGIESPCPKHAYYVNTMRVTDVVFGSACLALGAAVVTAPHLVGR